MLIMISSQPSIALQMQLTTLNVLADPSLSVPISEIARRFASDHNLSITTSYAASRAQGETIEEGLEADVFITARLATLEKLKAQGLIDVYSQKAVTRNRLVMVTYAENSIELILLPRLPLHAIFERIDPDYSFVIGDPDFQNAGFFALKALRNFEMAGDLEPHMLFVRSPVDVHKTIAQKGGYGIVYASEAKRNPELKVLGVFPEVAHSPILYYGVAVAGENMDAARSFLEYLGSDEAQSIFTRHGFESMQSYSAEGGHLAFAH